MSWFMVDVEADGPIPSDFSMIEIGVVVVEPGLRKQFTRKIKPISDRFIPEALAVTGYSRAMTLDFEDPAKVMFAFQVWISSCSVGKPLFISDNNGFDWQFVNYYFHHFVGKNPFGHSSTNLGSMYKGFVKSTYENFKHLRNMGHSHNPLHDAIGNAEALLKIADMGLLIDLETEQKKL